MMGRPTLPGQARNAALMALAIAGATVLASCEPAPPSPPVALPTLERPTLKLPGRPDRQRGQRVLVPPAAIVERGGLPGVFVLTAAAPYPPVPTDAGGTPLPQARFRMVKTGKTVGGRIEILSGLTGDEVLVLGDLTRVRDGSPIKTGASSG